jgi:Domain of unknown function (DUF4331)
MRRISIVAALLAAAVAAPLVIGSSHREAPNIMLDPSADNTDLYAWTAQDAPNALTVASNWIPGQDPANGPNFFRFDDRANYYIHFDNTGDGREDVSYRFEFDTKVRNPNSFLYALPGVTSGADAGLNVRQTYDIVRERISYRKNGDARVRERRVGNDLPVAPPNIGPKTFPNYDGLAAEAVRTLKDGTKVFVGQRDDPFFVDLGATFDAINVREGTGNEGLGKDDFSGMSTSSIVVQLPESRVTRDGRPVESADAANAVVGVWSTTERRKFEITPARYDKGSPAAVRGKENRFKQVSRLGNPLVNEVIIPLGAKDRFNRTTPDKDAAKYGSFVLQPELAGVLNTLFDVGAPTENRTDIVQAVLQGIPDLNQIQGAPKVKGLGTLPTDTLKINMGVAPNPNPSRFGVIGGDTAGYPNGRRLEDDVVDIDLQVVAGFLVGNEVPLGDGVDRNDKEFLDQFPYLAPPTSGFDNDPANRVEPQHAPVPAGG